jgi:hypothetical protein
VFYTTDPLFFVNQTDTLDDFDLSWICIVICIMDGFMKSFNIYIYIYIY